MRKNIVAGMVKSEKGFYIGDICYALSEAMYDGVWGGSGYKDGMHTDPETGYSFVVAGTKWGDGSYTDELFEVYYVDAGVLGIVPYELLAEDGKGGHYFEGAGEATMVAEDGKFRFYLPDGRIIHIDTVCEEEDEDDEHDWEEDGDEWD